MRCSMSEAALARHRLPDDYWEKSDNVLWAFTPRGIILHNFQRGAFLELDGAEHVIWSHLDGLHGDDDIVDKLASVPELEGRGRAALHDLVQRVLADLVEGGFVVRRAS